MRTHLIATCLILFLFHAASGADYATDRGATKVTGSFSAALQGGDLYDSGSESPASITGMLEVEGHPRPGLGVGLAVSLQYLRNSYSDRSLFGLGPFITTYFRRPSSGENLVGTILPYAKFGVLLGSFPDPGLNTAASHLYATLGADFMLSENVSLDLASRFGLIWKFGSHDKKTGQTIDLLLGAAYHVF